MGKPSGKKTKHVVGKTNDSSSKRNPKAFDEDTTVFINMSQELKEEGSKLFQKNDYEGAILKYEKALKLLPRGHNEMVYLRCNMAACYMNMGPGEYQRAINECNLALEISPKYSKALLKRARCYEALNRMELALRDVNLVLKSDPKNIRALEILERVRKGLDKKGMRVEEILSAQDPDSPQLKVVKEKLKKKKSRKALDKARSIEDKASSTEDKASSTEDKAVVEESPNAKEKAPRTAKLVFGEDIRWAELPGHCNILQLREIVRNRFLGLKAFLIKYKDQEGDLVTITTTEELRWAEESANLLGSLRLYIAEVDPEQEPLFVEESKNGIKEEPENIPSDNGSTRLGGENISSYIDDDWITEFARMFKNHVGFSSDSCLDLHEFGMKVYSEAMEEAITSEEAQDLFEIAEGKFQEMTALSLFNWGNVHMSRARKRVIVSEDASKELLLLHAKSAYDWACREYENAGERYKEALKLKPNFFEGYLALGLQQFEEAKLIWYFAVGSKVDFDIWPSEEMISLFDHAEDNIGKGSEIWEALELQRLSELTSPEKEKVVLKKVGLDGLSKDVSNDDAAEQASNMRSQINILWGTLLYERSVIEFKLGFEFWEDCLEAAIEKFELSGASRIDIAVMRKNHCSNATAQEGLGFKIDEIVQAWHEMYDAKQWLTGVPAFRLEPLFRRRVPKLHQILEHI